MPPKKKLYGKPPVRLMLTDVAGEDTVATLAPHSTVYIPKNGHKAEHAFEWSSKFFVVVAVDVDGAPCAVDKELRLRYEIFDSNDKTTSEPIHSSGTAKTWQRKYFWLQAVSFLDDGKYEVRFSADCPKYRHLAPVSYHVTALKKSSSASSCRAAAAASASEGESSEESESESELSESREEGELDAALASFHPRQLKNMPRVELQHLVVKVGVPAKVSNDDLRAVLTKWWQKRNQRTSPAKQAPRKAERAASPSADELLEDFDPVKRGDFRARGHSRSG